MPLSTTANGSFEVTIQRPGGWEPVGSLAFSSEFATRELDLSAVSFDDVSGLRITHRGEGAAHIDALFLGNQPPSAVLGAAEASSLALSKLLSSDYDVIHAGGRTLELAFDPPEGPTSLYLRARIEQAVLSDVPFQYPADNLYSQVTKSSAFYPYTLNSVPGRLQLDGELAGEELGAPLFSVFSRTGSGHPSGNTYGWVRNDQEHIYLAVDFLPDNTRDGGKDYCTLYVNGPAGLKAFKVSQAQEDWGVSGFAYSSRATYQHAVYELRVPLTEIGVRVDDLDVALGVAVAAYGTSNPPPSAVIDNFNEPAAGQQVTVAASGSTGMLAPGVMFKGERDIRGEETGAAGSFLVAVNPEGSGVMNVDTTAGGTGEVQAVWDGLDGDYNNIDITGTTFCFESGCGSDRITLTKVHNQGTEPIDITVRYHDNFGLISVSPAITVAPGTGPAAIEFMHTSFIPQPSFSLTDVAAVELLVNNSAQNAGANVSFDELLLSNEPVPVELLSFSVETTIAGVQLQWQTLPEHGIAGYRIYRANPSGELSRVSGLIPVEYAESGHHQYRFVNSEVEAGHVYRYRLTSVDTNGKEAPHGDLILLAGAVAPRG